MKVIESQIGDIETHIREQNPFEELKNFNFKEILDSNKYLNTIDDLLNFITSSYILRKKYVFNPTE